jgi:hypothetical protein
MAQSHGRLVLGGVAVVVAGHARAVAASWINGLGECYTFATRAATRRWQVGAELDGGRGVG